MGSIDIRLVKRAVDSMILTPQDKVVLKVFLGKLNEAMINGEGGSGSSSDGSIEIISSAEIDALFD